MTTAFHPVPVPPRESAQAKRSTRLAKQSTVSPLDVAVPLPADPLPGQRELIPPTAVEQLEVWLRDNDLTLFLDGLKRTQARLVYLRSLPLGWRDKLPKGRKWPFTVKEWRNASAKVCRWFECTRLAPESRLVSLSARQWDALKVKVTPLLLEMQGRPMRHCVRLVRTVVSTNKHQLRGLPERFHVWAGGARCPKESGQ